MIDSSTAVKYSPILLLLSAPVPIHLSSKWKPTFAVENLSPIAYGWKCSVQTNSDAPQADGNGCLACATVSLVPQFLL